MFCIGVKITTGIGALLLQISKEREYFVGFLSDVSEELCFIVKSAYEDSLKVSDYLGISLCGIFGYAAPPNGTFSNGVELVLHNTKMKVTGVYKFLIQNNKNHKVS